MRAGGQRGERWESQISTLHTHSHICAHTTHIHAFTHTYTQALGPVTNIVETQPGQGPAYSKRPGILPSPQAPSRRHSSAPSQAGGLGPGPATSYKIKNISNIQ